MHEQLLSFDFEHDTVNMIHFGSNLKRFQGKSNVMFDEMDELEWVLTDLQIPVASSPKDNRPVSTKFQDPVLRCRFKVVSSATGNLLPYNIFHELFPGTPKDGVKKSIDDSVHLLVYNKEEVKQYGTCYSKS